MHAVLRGVLQAVKGRPMSKDEVSLLYRVFDTNKDGFLEISGQCFCGYLLLGLGCQFNCCWRGR